MKARQDLKEGVVTRHGKEYSFLADGDDTPIYLDERNSATALNGDRVSATVTFNRKANRQEAIVGTVITRAKDTFVGVLYVDKHFAFLETTDKYLPYDIFIPKASLGSARNGDKVIVKIVEWPSRNNRSPQRCTPFWPSSACRIAIQRIWRNWLTRFPQTSTRVR